MSVTNQKILKTVEKLAVVLEEGFKKVDERFEKIDERLGRIDERVGRIDERVGTVDERLGKVEIILGNVTFMLANHDNLLKKIPTREEFDLFKSENATAHDRTVKAIEGFGQELASSSEAHDRLEERVDVHQEVLVKHKFLEPEPA